MIALDELAKSEFPKTTQFATATAVLMQAEPALEAGVARDDVAAAAPGDYVWLWKIDLPTPSVSAPPGPPHTFPGRHSCDLGSPAQ